jgi:pimeloyl-ACP methyl ester carboxylesterase
VTGWDELRDPELWLTCDGFAVPVWVTRSREPTARVLITSHGLTNDHHDAPLFAALRVELEREGATTLVEFDYPGSGRADGTLVDKRLELLRHTLVAVAARVRDEFAPVPIVVLGRSMGGTVALSALPELRPDGLIVMSPPYKLTVSLGRLQGGQADDGTYPLPAWSQPSGQVKGAVALSGEFFAELEEEERRVRHAAASAANVLLVDSTQDPKVHAEEMAELWADLPDDRGNARRTFDTDHNYESEQPATVRALVERITTIGPSAS